MISCVEPNAKTRKAFRFDVSGHKTINDKRSLTCRSPRSVFFFFRASRDARGVRGRERETREGTSDRVIRYDRNGRIRSCRAHVSMYQTFITPEYTKPPPRKFLTSSIDRSIDRSSPASHHHHTVHVRTHASKPPVHTRASSRHTSEVTPPGCAFFTVILLSLIHI